MPILWRRFSLLPEGAFAAVCSKSGDPGLGGWSASRADQVASHSFCREQQLHRVCELLPGDDGSFKARKSPVCRLPFLDAR
jgi:hypothetical protein